MSHFAVSNSTLSANELGIFLKQRFALPENTTCKLLKTGINHTYLVDAGHQKFIYRVYSYQWRTEMEILEEIRLLEELKAHDIPVSYALKDAEGQYIQILDAPEGQRSGVMFSYAAGEKLLNFPKELHEKIGEIMAQMHKVTHDLSLKRVNYGTETLLSEPLKYISQFLSAEADEMGFLLSTREVLLKHIREANTDEIRKGIIHTDIWCDNLNILNNEEVTLFDFDFCGNGWLVQDVAYYILQIKSTEKVNEEYKEKKAWFLKGYESVTPLTATEKSLIPTLAMSCYYFYLGIQCRRYDNWSNVFLNENYLKRFISILLKGWFDYNEMDKK
ncbi:phosphotransferase [Emticicia sp. CRIBPO]|uniref:phosphotransferase n=1 Tax=Emticicia sp. CRIBPO TaxID=2683258 RepID=UPI0014124E2F|nr:phosphotransferase [Emticicia sp. CRIBPO]NBA87439.1 phosphotransferase [Emticicia sp. CRIBPO]